MSEINFKSIFNSPCDCCSYDNNMDKCKYFACSLIQRKEAEKRMEKMNEKEKEFTELYKYHIEHFKVIIRGEFEVKSENTEFIHEFEVESNHINTAIKELGKKINIAVLEKSKNILKDLRDDNK